MSQFEQENDLGRGGGEVDEETMREAEERGGVREPDEPAREGDEPRGDRPWPKFGSGSLDA